MAQELSFTDVAVTTVKPLHKTVHLDAMDPTSLDLPSTDAYVPLFFAYRLGDNSEALYLQLAEQIKEALQKVLIPFFSFAGRWIAHPKGSSSRKLLCNDVGVPFIEAYMDANLDSVVRASAEFQPVPKLQGFGFLGMDVTQMRQEMQPEGLPPIFVQLSRFKCGGVVLAVAFNHMHTDAKGFFDFMTAWSELSRTNESSIKVEHNRALAEVQSHRDFFFKHRRPETASAGADSQGLPKAGVWPMKVYEVSATSIKSVKQEAKERKDGPGFVSSGDCIIAHVWKGLSRLPSEMLGGRELTVSIAVEGRSRFFNPPIPNLCGNAVAAMVAPRIPTREVQELPVVSIASKLRQKLLTTKREDWLSSDRLEEAFEASRGLKFAAMRVTSWASFPMYGIDFGFGRPYFASGINSLFKSRGDAMMYIGPPIPSSSSSIATVCLKSTRQLLEALECYPEFLLFFLPRAHSNESSVSEQIC